MSVLVAMLQSLRANMQYVAGAGTLGLSALVMYPQFWGLNRYKHMLQMYRDGELEPVDDDSKKLTQKVFDTVLWDPLSEANVQLFTVYGQDIVHRGSTFSRYGGIVGIPVHFRYRTKDDVETDKIILNNKTIDWTSEAGQQLLESLVLSENARQFAIARELFYLRSHHIQIRPLMIGMSMFTAYWMGAAANMTFNLSHRLPVVSRGIVYTFFASIGATLYCLASDNYSWFRDRKADQKAAELGPGYAAGGLEFYSRLLLRNMALRKLMGPEGGKRYTAYGNDIHFWRSPTVPLTARKDALKELVQSHLSQNSPVEGNTVSAPA